MLNISNIKVYDLKESVIASRNAMRTEMPEYTDEEFNNSLPRAISLAKCGGGSGHSNFRKGIRVSFDIKYPNYFSPELQRYHFFDIVTSSSKMHKLTSMDMDACFNEYVTQESKDQMKRLLDDYSKAETNDDKYTCFMRLLSNCPQGIELFMRVTTNYEQLATIYRQRRNHKLREWHIFCKMIESLPFAHQLIIGDKTTIDSTEFNSEMAKL
jgi:hypothetical protein